jgi:hypothetical protein
MKKNTKMSKLAKAKKGVKVGMTGAGKKKAK